MSNFIGRWGNEIKDHLPNWLPDWLNTDIAAGLNPGKAFTGGEIGSVFQQATDSGMNNQQALKASGRSGLRALAAFLGGGAASGAFGGGAAGGAGGGSALNAGGGFAIGSDALAPSGLGAWAGGGAAPTTYALGDAPAYTGSTLSSGMFRMPQMQQQQTQSPGMISPPPVSSMPDDSEEKYIKKLAKALKAKGVQV